MENIIDLLPERTGIMTILQRGNGNERKWSFIVIDTDVKKAEEGLDIFSFEIVIHTPEQAEKYAEQFRILAERMRKFDTK